MSGNGGGFGQSQQYYGSALPSSNSNYFGAGSNAPNYGSYPQGVASYTMPNLGGFNFGNYTGMNYVPNSVSSPSTPTTDPTQNAPAQYGHPSFNMNWGGPPNWRYFNGGQFGQGTGTSSPTGPTDTTGATDQHALTPVTPPVTAPTTPPTTPPTPPVAPPNNTNTPPVNPPSTTDPSLLAKPKAYNPASDGYAGGPNQYQIQNGSAGLLSGVPQSALQAIQMMGQSNDPGSVLAAVGQQLGQQGMSQDTINQIVQQARGGAGQGIVQATQGMGQPNFAGSPYAQFFQQPTGWQPGQPFRQA